MKSSRFCPLISGAYCMIFLTLILSVLFSSGTCFPATVKTSAVVFITDGNEKWSPTVEEELYPGGISLPSATKTADAGDSTVEIKFVSLKDALNEKIFHGITPEERVEMLRFPGALLASKRAGSVFNVDYIFLVKLFKADNKWVAESAACHIPDGEVECMGLKSDRDRKKAMDMAVAEIPTTVELMRETLVMPVVGSDVGKLYHKKGADHITGKGTRQEFSNSRLARKAGYKPCAICNPEKTRYFANDSLEVALGQELTSLVESSFVMSENSGYKERVLRLGQNIVKSSDLNNYTYRFRVLDTDIVNAYSVPAGGVYITRGLLELVESDDELGGIIAHEIAHTESHHAVKMYRRARANSYLGAILVIATGSPLAQFFAGFVNNFFVSGWSRGFEAEADRSGILLMSAAGLDPTEYTVVLKKLSDRSKLKKSGPEWFRTHPTDEQRLKEAAKTTESLKVVHDAYGEIEKIDPETALYVRSHPLSYMDDAEYLKKFIKDLSALHFTTPSGNQAEDNPAIELSPSGGSQNHPVKRHPVPEGPPESVK